MPAGIRIRIQQRKTGPLPNQNQVSFIIVRLRNPAENGVVRRMIILRRQDILNPPRRVQVLHPPTLDSPPADVNSAQGPFGNQIDFPGWLAKLYL